MRRIYHRCLHKWLYMCLTLIGLLLLSNVFPHFIFASAISNNKAISGVTLNQRFIAQQPDKQSLLIVLLDRSGSLINAPDPTDPDDYSTSVTRALTDLWPGKMIVITFPKVDPLVEDQVGQLGPHDLTDATQRQILKNEIGPADPDGNTPLGPAMDSALHILTKGPAPAGSQAIIITDGSPNMTSDPNGDLETNHIEHALLPQFHQLGIPIHTFGLKITDPQATNLLTEIARQTGANYTPVLSSTDLAQQVIRLCANWLNLKFQSSVLDPDGRYPVTISELTTTARIIVFRSQEQYPITITAPDGNTLLPGVGIQQFPDKHYQIDQLDVTPPVNPGSYHVFVGHDPEAQVYWLVDTSLRVSILAPTAANPVYVGQPVVITATLLNGSKSFSPDQGAVLLADVTFTTPGQAPATTEVKLIQQNKQDLYRSDQKTSPVYNTPGALQIVVRANYKEIHQESQLETLKLDQKPCLTAECFIQSHLTQIIVWGIVGIIIFALIIIIGTWYLIWRRRSAPTGYLINAHNERNILELGTYRPTSAKLFKKSVITMQELSQHPQIKAVGTLVNEPLAFVATQEGIALRALGSNLAHMSVRTAKAEAQFSPQQSEIPLGNRSEILRNGVHEVTFQLASPRSRIPMKI